MSCQKKVILNNNNMTNTYKERFFLFSCLHIFLPFMFGDFCLVISEDYIYKAGTANC